MVKYMAVGLEAGFFDVNDSLGGYLNFRGLGS